MAFPIRKNGTTDLGILTAGHCPDTGTYGGMTDAFYAPQNYSLSTTYEIPNGGDFRWNWSRYHLTGATYMGTGARRFTASGFAYVNGVVCNYGVYSQLDCANVTHLNRAMRVVPGGHAGLYLVGPLVEVDRAITKSGDSGGPWYIGTTGIGVHTGLNLINNRSVFSNLPYVLNKLGVSLIY